MLAELERVRVAAEISRIKHPNLVAAQAKGVRDLEQRGVPKRRYPALVPGDTHTGDLLVGVAEEPLQLIEGERALRRVDLAVLDMARAQV